MQLKKVFSKILAGGQITALPVLEEAIKNDPLSLVCDSRTQKFTHNC
jgi:hypothetical protein